MKEYMSIGEFAKEIGVSEGTLRNWEKNGKLLPHHRTKGNQRVYSKEQAEEFLNAGKILVIQGKKKRDVYFFNYEDNTVSDKIGNTLVLRETPDGVNELTLEDALDHVFHTLYELTNGTDRSFRADRNMGDIEWVRMA